MNIIKNKFIFLTLSGLLVAAAIVALATFGLRQGIDFVGGTSWQVAINKPHVMAMDVGLALQELQQKDFTVINIAEQTFLIRMKELTEIDHQRYLEHFQKIFGSIEERSFESIGASIGHELRSKSLWSFALVLIGISLYIAFAFRKVSRPVSSWKYGIITLLTLFHDALIPAGLMAVLGYWLGVDVGINFIVAILVVMGFSVHDTIVVFDRIRENLRLDRSSNPDFAELVNRSIVQTIARSINTSLTLVLVLLALYIFGAPALKYFTLVILVGTIVGTYSSIFVASPLLVLWRRQ